MTGTTGKRIPRYIKRKQQQQGENQLPFVKEGYNEDESLSFHFSASPTELSEHTLDEDNHGGPIFFSPAALSGSTAAATTTTTTVTSSTTNAATSAIASHALSRGDKNIDGTTVPVATVESNLSDLAHLAIRDLSSPSSDRATSDNETNAMINPGSGSCPGRGSNNDYTSTSTSETKRKVVVDISELQRQALDRRLADAARGRSRFVTADRKVVAERDNDDFNESGAVNNNDDDVDDNDVDDNDKGEEDDKGNNGISTQSSSGPASGSNVGDASNNNMNASCSSMPSLSSIVEHDSVMSFDDVSHSASSIGSSSVLSFPKSPANKKVGRHITFVKRFAGAPGTTGTGVGGTNSSAPVYRQVAINQKEMAGNLIDILDAATIQMPTHGEGIHPTDKQRQRWDTHPTSSRNESAGAGTGTDGVASASLSAPTRPSMVASLRDSTVNNQNLTPPSRSTRTNTLSGGRLTTSGADYNANKNKNKDTVPVAAPKRPSFNMSNSSLLLVGPGILSRPPSLVSRHNQSDDSLHSIPGRPDRGREIIGSRTTTATSTAGGGGGGGVGISSSTHNSNYYIDDSSATSVLSSWNSTDSSYTFDLSSKLSENSLASLSHQGHSHHGGGSSTTAATAAANRSYKR